MTLKTPIIHIEIDRQSLVIFIPRVGFLSYGVLGAGWEWERFDASKGG